MSKATVTELEVLFTANTQQVDKAAKGVQDQAQKIEKNPVKVELDGNAKGALDAMDRVEAEAKKIVSAKTMATVDANIERAETSLTKVQERLDYLRSVDGEMEVTADIKRAEAALQQITRRRDALVSAKESMVIDADTSPAEAALDDVADEAGEAGDEGGRKAGAGLADGIVASLATIPIAGAVVGVGVAAGKALMDAIQEGLGVDKRQDRLQALTGITEGEAAKFGRAAGEAYANVFGESIEANMDTARIAVQQGLLDPKATTRQAQQVIQSLSGIADVLEEDVQPVSVAVTQLLKTGLVKSADEAFDLLATGAREGVNAQEDLLDTFTEYPSLFQRLGLSGAEALGLINQGLGAGARNSDLAADALKEFQIRATDGSKASAEGFKILGLNAADMTAQIAQGGESARNGLDTVLDKLREIEDPVARNAAAVALFGTQAEDLGEALFAMDLSSAVDQLNGVTGSAQRMFDTLANNDATKIEEAQRNIEVAADGIKGALAAAFSEPMGDFAEFVSEHRAEVVGFLLDIANGGLDLGRTMVEGMATGVEAVGDFGASLVPLIVQVGNVAIAMDKAFNRGRGAEDLKAFFDDAQLGMYKFHEQTEQAAATMRTELIENGIDPAQQRLNEFGIPQVLQAEFHDASLRAAQSLDAVGYSAEGTALSLEGVDLSALSASEAGSALESQLQAAVAALDAEAAAGARAGETQESLAQKYELGRQALFNQLVQMGMTEDQAWALIDTYGAVPGKIDTAISSNAGAVTVEVGGLAYKVENLPDGSFSVTAVGNAWEAVRTVTQQLDLLDGRRINVSVQYNARGEQINGVGYNSRLSEDGSLSERGNVLKAFMNGGMTGAGFPVARVPQIQRGGANVLWAEDPTIWEAYISGKPGMRDRNVRIWEEAGRRLGAFEDGGFSGPEPARAASLPSPAPLVMTPTVSLAGARVVVQVGSREFEGYIADVADARVAEHGASQDRAAQYL
ncbi:phage tail tape measure protein [Cellulosimicrobium funkei]|uniref:phage tail tape measure protein n=1 Tax=Cellulosimicrobium funkei TaxID=264251 RepID=UPI0036CDAE97